MKRKITIAGGRVCVHSVYVCVGGLDECVCAEMPKICAKLQGSYAANLL